MGTSSHCLRLSLADEDRPRLLVATKAPTLMDSLTSLSLSKLGSYFLPPPPILSSDPSVMAITTMLKELKAAVEEYQPMAYPFVVLSVPDIIDNSASDSYYERFQLSATQSGLSFLTPLKSASISALNYHYIEDCYSDIADDDHCNPDIKVVLTISYSDVALEATILTRWHGALLISDSTFEVALGANVDMRNDDPPRYWDAFIADLSKLIGELPIDKLILLGSQYEDDQGLHSAVNDVLKERGRNESMDVLMKSTDGKVMGSGLWFGSRGAAVIARRGMWHGFNACMPNSWCEVSDYHDEL